jgi:LmeA-like phospholipid-binding
VFIVVRLVRLVLFLVLILVVLGIVGFVLGRPFVERLAARSIEDRLGTPVRVSIATSIKPSMARGDLGEVTVKAAHFERDGLQLAGTRAVYEGVKVQVADLITGSVKLHYGSVRFTAQLTQTALVAYLEPVLSQHGLPSKNLHVTIGKGKATLRSGPLHAAVRAKIVGVSSVELVPVNGSRVLLSALAAPIQLGPLPDGVHLTAITLHKGGATIAGRGDAGDLKT